MLAKERGTRPSPSKVHAAFVGTWCLFAHRREVHEGLPTDLAQFKRLICAGRRRRMLPYATLLTAYLGFPLLTCVAQQPTPGVLAKASEQGSESKRLFGIIPNYRTSASLNPYVPLTTREKFKIASQDSFDRGTFVLAAAFAGESQLTNANRSFGQGVAGYARYLGTSYADFVIGDYMTEAIYPSLLHQDPRYFRRGTGTTWQRLGYAIGQIFETHNDSGAKQFNYSEFLGNASAVAISNSYYADNRDVSDAATKFGSQISVDLASNILKEFSPDIRRKFARKRDSNSR